MNALFRIKLASRLRPRVKSASEFDTPELEDGVSGRLSQEEFELLHGKMYRGSIRSGDDFSPGQMALIGGAGGSLIGGVIGAVSAEKGERLKDGLIGALVTGGGGAGILALNQHLRRKDEDRNVKRLNAHRYQRFIESRMPENVEEEGLFNGVAEDTGLFGEE
jgi:hypothetical protein